MLFVFILVLGVSYNKKGSRLAALLSFICVKFAICYSLTSSKSLDGSSSFFSPLLISLSFFLEVNIYNKDVAISIS